MDMLLLVDNYYIGTSGSCSGIYCFENLIDGKRYTGQGQILKRRRTTHFRDLKNNKDSEYFQIAWNEVGKENFKLWIVEECSIELLNEREIYWIKELHSHISDWGYNKTWGGQCVRGHKHSDETKQKIKEAQSGKNHYLWGKRHSPETIQKIKDNMPDLSGENNHNFGKHPSSETIQKIKDNHSGTGMLGKKHTEESMQKIKDNMPDMFGINNPNILKKEVAQQIKDMLDKNIRVAEIVTELKVNIATVKKVKNGFYKDIYGI